MEDWLFYYWVNRCQYDSEVNWLFAVASWCRCCELRLELPKVLLQALWLFFLHKSHFLGGCYLDVLVRISEIQSEMLEVCKKIYSSVMLQADQFKFSPLMSFLFGQLKFSLTVHPYRIEIACKVSSSSTTRSTVGTSTIFFLVANSTASSLSSLSLLLISLE